MKKVKKIMVPALVLLLGASAAFATDYTTKSERVTEDGYFYDATALECVNKEIECTTDPGEPCMWTDAQNVEHRLQRLSGTSCTIELNKP